MKEGPYDRAEIFYRERGAIEKKSRTPMKILFFMPDKGTSHLDGTTSDAVNVAKSFAQGNIPSIFIFNGHVNIFQHFKNAGVDVRRFDMPVSGVKQHMNPFYRRRFSRHIKKLIADENIDVLHLGQSGSYVLNYLKDVNILKACVQQAATPDFKKVGLFDGGVNFRPKALLKAWYRKYVRLNYKRCELVICLSNAAKIAAERTYNVDPDRAVVVFPGVTGRLAESEPGIVRAELGDTEGYKIIVSVGRITKAKGVEEFGEVAKKLIEKGKRYRFVFVGQERSEAYGQMIRQKYGQFVTFLPPRQAIGNCYADADLYMHTSHRESGPLTIIEAMEFGVPSVAWDIPGCNEQIVDGVTGSLVKFGDITALAVATENLLDNQLIYDRASAASLERFKRHNVSDYAPRLLQAYDVALRKKRGA